MHHIDPLKIVIGAGPYNNNPRWYHTQKEELDLLAYNNWTRLFKPNSLKAILVEHVWEHLTYEEGLIAAKTCYEFLQPDGYIRCAVPDRFFPNSDYQKTIQIGGPGPSDHPAANHKIVYSYTLLQKLFESAGFHVQLLEYFDEKGNFHTNNWSGDDGVIFRSKKYDPRNHDSIQFPSLIIDAIKRSSKRTNH